MPVTIAPIDQYASEWSEAEIFTNQAESLSEGTGVTLSPSNVWLANADAIAQEIQTGDEILLSQTRYPQTPNLLDETEVSNINVIAINDGDFSLADGSTEQLAGQTQSSLSEDGLLSFSLDVSGGTQSNPSSNTGVSPVSAATMSTSGSPPTNGLRSPTSTSALTSSEANAEQNFLEAELNSLELANAEEVLSSSESPSTETSTDISSSASGSGSSPSAAVPLDFSSSLGLSFILVIILFLRWWRYRTYLNILLTHFE